MKKIVSLILIILSLLGYTQEVWAFFPIFSVSTEEEITIGKRIARSIEKKLPIYKDLEYEKRLTKVGYKLVHVSDRRDLEYTFTIIDKEEINAFATFGGFIYINKGAMDKCDSDDELAAILAHEIGHISAKHLAKRMEQSKLFSFGFFALDAFVLRKQKHGRDIRRAVGFAYDIIQKGYTREDEIEADRLGTRYSHNAGYNPLGAITILEKLKKEKREKGPVSPFENIDILRTHPYIDDRIDIILSEVANIKAEEAFKKHKE